MQKSISFVLDGKILTLLCDGSAGVRPTTTVLDFLRSLPGHTGVKEGCAEGDCGACTVVVGQLDSNGALQYRALDSCLVFLPMLHGKQLITVENLKGPSGELHPVQSALVETHGSQCGYCTPGIIMSMFALYKSPSRPSLNEIDDALAGNLCRCTGYTPIVEAAARACAEKSFDHFAQGELHIIELLKSIPRESVSLEAGGERYFRPLHLSEALSFKHQCPSSTVVCGGTDVALRITKAHERLPEILDLSGIRELCTCSDDQSGFRIGAGATLSDLAPRVKTDLPALYDMLSVFGSRQIRNIATLGGNLGTASPIGDTLPVLLAYDARVVLQSVNGKRELGLGSYIRGYRSTERKQDELVTEIIIPKVPPHVLVRSYKVSKRKDLDISTVSACFKVELNRNNRVHAVALAYGGMADHVKRASHAEELLVGEPWERGTVERAMSIIDEDFTPISDVRGSATFRRIAARNLLLKFWLETSRRGERLGG